MPTNNKTIKNTASPQSDWVEVPLNKVSKDSESDWVEVPLTTTTTNKSTSSKQSTKSSGPTKEPSLWESLMPGGPMPSRTHNKTFLEKEAKLPQWVMNLGHSINTSKALDWTIKALRNTEAIFSKSASKFLQGGTAGALNLDEGTVGIPLVSNITGGKKIKLLDEGLNESLKEEGVSPAVADNQYIGIVPEIVGSLPTGGWLSRTVKWGSEALGVGTELASKAPEVATAGQKILKVGGRILHAGITGGLYNEIAVHDQGQDTNMLHLGTQGFLWGAGLQIAGEGIYGIAQAKGALKVKAFRDVVDNISKWAYGEGKFNSLEEAQAQASKYMTGLINDAGGLDNISLRTAGKFQKEIEAFTTAASNGEKEPINVTPPVDSSPVTTAEAAIPEASSTTPDISTSQQLYKSLAMAQEMGIDPLKVDPITYSQAIDPAWSASDNPEGTLGYKALTEHPQIVQDAIDSGKGAEVSDEVRQYYDELSVDNSQPTVTASIDSSADETPFDTNEEDNTEKPPQLPLISEGDSLPEETSTEETPEPLVDLSQGGVVTPVSDAQLAKFTERLVENSSRSSSDFSMDDLGFNPTKMSPDDVVKVIDATASIVRDKYPTTETLEETTAKAQKAAKNMGYDILDEVRQQNESMKDLASRLTAWESFMNSEAASIDKLANKIVTKAASPLEEAQYMYQVSHLGELQPLLKGIQTNAARTVSAGRIIRDGSWANLMDLTNDELINNPDLGKDVEAVINKIPGGSDGILKHAQEWKKSQGLSGKVKLAKDKGKSRPILDALAEAAMTSVQSNPITWIVNMMGNSIRPFMEVIDNTLASGVGALYGSKERILMKEVAYDMFGNLMGLVDMCARKPKVMIQESEDVPPITKDAPNFLDFLFGVVELPEKIEEAVSHLGFENQTPMRGEAHLRKAISRGNLESTLLGKTVNFLTPDQMIRDSVWQFVNMYGALARNLSYSVMKVGDLPGEYAGYNAKLYAESFREAVSRGLDDKEATSFMANIIPKVRQYRDGEHLKASKDEVALIKKLHIACLDESKDRTWKQDLTGLLHKIEPAFQHPLTKVMLNLFYKTPIQVERYFLKSCPFTAWACKSNWEDWSGSNGDRARDRAIARVIRGSLLTILGMYLVMHNGNITGTQEKKEVEADRAANILPNSIHGNGVDYDYGRVDPYNSYLSLCADLDKSIRYYKSDTPGQAFTMFAIGLGNATLNKTFAKGVADKLRWVTEPNYGGKQIGMNMVRQFIPFSGMATFLKDTKGSPLYDPHMREMRSFMDLINPKYPQLDWLGKPLEKNPKNAGVRTAETNDDSPIRMEAVRLGLQVSQPDNKVLNTKGIPVTLNQEDYWKYRRYADTKLHMEDTLNEVIKSEGYKQLSDETKRKYLSSLVQKYHRYMELYYTADNKVKVVHEIKKNMHKYIKLMTAPSENRPQTWRDFLYDSQMQRNEILNSNDDDDDNSDEETSSD